MMQGIGNSCSVEGSLRKPLAARPKRRAALTMLLALLPSRETPQATRSCSSGTQAPWWASTIARAAAPHSTASICRIVGVRFTALRQSRPRARRGCGFTWSGFGWGKGALSINSRKPLDERQHQVQRALPSCGDFRLHQRPAAETNGRSLANGPAISADGGSVLFQTDHCGAGGSLVRETGHKAVVVEHCRHALRCYGEIGDRHDGADHGSKFLALHRAGLDPDLHSRLYALAAL